jgi:hypothetical protein
VSQARPHKGIDQQDAIPGGDSACESSASSQRQKEGFDFSAISRQAEHLIEELLVSQRPEGAKCGLEHQQLKVSLVEERGCMVEERGCISTLEKESTIP